MTASIAVVIAKLRERDVYDLCDDIARRHGIPLEDALSSARVSEVVEARHAIWLKIYHWFGGNLSATARLFGVDHSSVYYAVSNAPPGDIIRVLLATFETDHHAYHFLWVSGRVNPYGITDRVENTTTWFPSYDLARAVFAECCERAGAPTFRSSAAPRLEAPTFRAVASLGSRSRPPDIPPDTPPASGGLSP